MAISSAVIIISLLFTPFSKLFIGAGVALGALLSLSTIEELTGGRELTWLTIALAISGDLFLTSWSFAGIGFLQRVILFVQLLAVIVVTESVILLLFSSRLRNFCARRTSINLERNMD